MRQISYYLVNVIRLLCYDKGLRCVVSLIAKVNSSAEVNSSVS